MSAIRVGVIIAIVACGIGCRTTSRSINAPIIPDRVSSDGTDRTTYFEFQVDTSVRFAGGPAPAYPDSLRALGIEGEVRVQFVVDTTGQMIPKSLRIISSSHELFSAEVRRALPNMRFYPAQIGSRKVRQLVEQPFTFTLNR